MVSGLRFACPVEQRKGYIMAEIVLKVKNDGGSYDDGDILCAFSDRRISDVHVQHICNPKEYGFNSDGLRDMDTLLEIHLQNVMEFRFERVSETELTRHSLRNGEVDLISNIPNDSGECMDVELYLKRRKGHARHKIFGSIGSEIWYGGNTRSTEKSLDKVWGDIEDRTGDKKSNHPLFPTSDIVKAHFLGLSVDPFDDIEGNELVASETEKNGDEIVIIEKRKFKVDYREMKVISVETQAHIQDMKVLVDVRGANKINLRSEIAIVKK